MRSHTAAALILMTACLSAADPSGLAIDGPGGAQVFLPVGQSLPKGARLVLSSGAEPPLPRDLVARSSPFTLEPRGAFEGLDLIVSIPTDALSAELYISDGATWARVSSQVSGGLLRATVRSTSHLVVASTRAMVWHEVRAPRGGLSSFVFSGHRIYAMSSAQGAVVSDDEGETWVALAAEEKPPLLEASALPRLDPARTAALGPFGRRGEISALAGAGARLYVALEDGSVRFSDDAGGTWRDYSGGLPADPGPPVLASDGSTLFASMGGRTYKARAP